MNKIAETEIETKEQHKSRMRKGSPVELLVIPRFYLYKFFNNSDSDLKFYTLRHDGKYFYHQKEKTMLSYNLIFKKAKEINRFQFFIYNSIAFKFLYGIFIRYEKKRIINKCKKLILQRYKISKYYKQVNKIKIKYYRGYMRHYTTIDGWENDKWIFSTIMDDSLHRKLKSKFLNHFYCVVVV